MDEKASEFIAIWVEAKSYIEQGNYDKAIETYKYILVRYGDSPTAVEYANAYLGDIYLTLGQPDLAESHVKKAIKCNSEKPEYHYILGFAYSKQNHWEKAIREYEMAIGKTPDNAEYLRGLGWAVSNNGDMTKGIGYLQKAVALEPSNINILLDMANVYLLNLEFEKAKQASMQALELDPGHSLARLVFEKICEFQKRYENVKAKEAGPKRNGLDR
jgi:tetratricopeptide (TPR) repeat protein